MSMLPSRLERTHSAPAPANAVPTLASASSLPAGYVPLAARLSAGGWVDPNEIHFDPGHSRRLRRRWESAHPGQLWRGPQGQALEDVEEEGEMDSKAQGLPDSCPVHNPGSQVPAAMAMSPPRHDKKQLRRERSQRLRELLTEIEARRAIGQAGLVTVSGWAVLS